MVTWVGGAVESPAAGWSELADVLDRALTFPPDHHLRWQVLKELDRFGTGTVVAEAVDLARSGDPQRAVLGVEMLSTVPPRRDFVAAQWPTVAAVLDLLIHPGQNPDILIAGVSAWAAFHPREQDLLLELLSHRVPGVRLRAAAQLGLADHPHGEARAIRLANLVANDPDVRVREEAAEALAFVYLDAQLREDKATIRQVVRCFLRHCKDPAPGVRAAVINVEVDLNPPSGLARLASELARPDVDWRFVAVAQVVVPEEDRDRRPLLEVLLELRESGWPGLAVEGTFPDRYERAELLEAAIERLSEPI